MPCQELKIGLCFWQVGHLAMAETLNQLWRKHMLSNPYTAFIPVTIVLLLTCPLCQHWGGINMVTLPDHFHMPCASTPLYFYLLIFLFPSPLTASQVISRCPWVLKYSKLRPLLFVHKGGDQVHNLKLCPLGRFSWWLAFNAAPECSYVAAAIYFQLAPTEANHLWTKFGFLLFMWS